MTCIISTLNTILSLTKHNTKTHKLTKFNINSQNAVKTLQNITLKNYKNLQKNNKLFNITLKNATLQNLKQRHTQKV